MAAIDLKYLVYAPLTEDDTAGTYTYGTGKRGRKLTKADIKITTDNAKLYADGDITESLKEFISGVLTITQDDLTATMRKDWLGNTLTEITIGTGEDAETGEEITSNVEDNPPYVGIGFVQPKVVDKVRLYRAVFLTKVQFAEPDESGETKGEKIAWQTPVVVGDMFRRIDGSWKEEITVPSLGTAIDYLKQKANIT